MEGYAVYERSRRRVDGVEIALVRGPSGKSLWLSRALPGFRGDPLPNGGILCPLVPEIAAALLKLLPELRPRRLPEGPSFGFGDRLGLATPGHVRAARGSRVFPVLAQQSVRENARTGRTFAEVLADAVFGALQEGYTGGFAADADHLKSIEDALEAAELGYTLFTCDPSDHVVPAEELPEKELRRRFDAIPKRAELEREYRDRTFEIKGLGRLRFSELDLARAAVKYLGAVEFAAEMYRALREKLPDGFDFELSVDETETPTSPLEHFFVVQELKKRDVELTSLAPRFSGSLEKAVDYHGDLEVFRRDLRAHVAIAVALGGYRISLHSGSDKFSLYPLFAREADGWFHVKTAGTSYLVALEVVARRAPELFREIYALSVERFPEDRATYHLTTDLSQVPDPSSLPDEELPKLLEEPDPRQVLHVAYGSVLRSPLGAELKKALLDFEEDYAVALEAHLGRHLEHLGVRG
ncbi:tagaturonate epimerase family protein [Candidatus Bipolaricaulota sp. J31]